MCEMRKDREKKRDKNDGKRKAWTTKARTERGKVKEKKNVAEGKRDTDESRRGLKQIEMQSDCATATLLPARSRSQSRYHTERGRIHHGSRAGGLHGVREERRVVPAVIPRLRHVDAAEAQLHKHMPPIMRVQLRDPLLRDHRLRLELRLPLHRIKRIVVRVIRRRDERVAVVVRRRRIRVVPIRGHPRRMERVPVGHRLLLLLLLPVHMPIRLLLPIREARRRIRDGRRERHRTLGRRHPARRRVDKSGRVLVGSRGGHAAVRHGVERAPLLALRHTGLVRHVSCYERPEEPGVVGRRGRRCCQDRGLLIRVSSLCNKLVDLVSSAFV
ncbi:hypothetical protein BOTBODRAFT_421276 [Botryobasidium botryosum FD-172 SS1]|uniref:Uncharacterized protein n=1 Tax=Botryobasidium botryosum (strain FD-172 SS1) TaxID=930990 RepID=A0A067M9B7_BOTB1|nr:hypothetical protein BOTBODRAFT_421276 [Botryobasidium botryosum FD-172 SS1]